jgi:hypothetical protein
MSQLIKAAPRRGNAANIIASRGALRGTQSPKRDQEQCTQQHRVDVDGDPSSRPLLVGQVGPLQSAECTGDQTFQFQKPAGEHRVFQNWVAVIEVGSVALQQATTGVGARCRSGGI